MIRSIAKAVLPRILPRNAYNHIHGRAVVRDILAGRKIEPPMREIAEYVREGSTALDIGANQGRYTFYLSKYVGAAGIVYAFEPIPYNIRILDMMIARAPHRNIVLVPAACGEESKIVSFTIPLKHGAPYGGWAHRSANGPDKGEKLLVQMLRLDNLFTSSHKQDISFIKCDIEGMELLAFRGALETIKLCRPAILCEVSPEWLPRYGLTPDDVFTFFRQLNYSVRSLDHEDNFLFLPEPSH